MLVIDYSKLPSLLAVALLASAYASVARRCHVPGAALWLWGWSCIALHFFTFLFLNTPGLLGTGADFVGTAALAWAAFFFIRAMLPYRDEPTTRWMMAAYMAGNSIYIGIILLFPNVPRALIPAAILYGFLPLATASITIPDFQHHLRWSLVGFNCLLALYLLVFQLHAGNGPLLALHGILFASYLACFAYFLSTVGEVTMGGFVTAAGFLTWSLVFIASPIQQTYFASLNIENEVWNLPKYVVAAGMILLVLEKQIEHNKYLALHDELTGLPNRRLFHDRLHTTLERASRRGKSAALLLIDLDCFKQVNDSLGHHIGDGLLRQVGTIFSHRLRRSDTVARTGGDEFAVILEEPITRIDAERVARSLAELIETPFQVEQHTIRIGASVGVSFYPEDGVTSEALCIAADARMYDAKNGNRTLKTSSIGVPLPRPAEYPSQPIAVRSS